MTEPATKPQHDAAPLPGRRRRALYAIGSAALVIAAIAGFVGLRASADDEAPRVDTVGAVVPEAPPTTATTTGPAFPVAPPATAKPTTAPPVTLEIPAIGVAAPVVPVGVVDGTDEVEVPPIEEVGWYRYGAAPGDTGSSVLLGHIDGGGRQGVFFRLGQLEPGADIDVARADGSTRRFRVVAREQFAKVDLPPELFAAAGPTRIVLITCGGSFDESAGRYRDNIVVTAEPLAA